MDKTKTPASDGSRPPERTWQDVVVCCVAIVLCVGALAQWALKGMGVEFPTWLDGETANHMAGAVTMTDLPSSLSEVPEAFATGELQHSIDARLTQNIPMRGLAVLGNAALQRASIQASNALFRFPVYPTFYGSRFSYYSAYDALLRSPLKDMDAGWQDFATQLASFAEGHGDVRFLVYVGTEASDRDVNPTYGLTSNTEDIEDMGAVLEASLSGVPNVSMLVEDFEDAGSYYDLYFKADNHWTIEGALDAYNAIAREMGLDALEVDGLVGFEPRYFGTWARNGLYPLADDPTDLDEDFSDLTIETGGYSYGGQDHSHYEEAPELYQAINYIQEYYNLFGVYSDSGVVSIDSSSMADEDKLPAIVICDSYGYQTGRMLARGFGHVDIRYWLYGNSSGDERLEDVLAETGDKIVVFVGAPEYYSNFLARHPQFFE